MAMSKHQTAHCFFVAQNYMVVFTLIFCSQQQGPLRSENARLAILNNTIRAAKSSRNHELKLLTLICVDHGRGTLACRAGGMNLILGVLKLKNGGCKTKLLENDVLKT